MSETVQCRRCGQANPALDRAPIPGTVGQQIVGSTCSACWIEWERAEVMVINELQLNFMDPEAANTLHQHMREFLCLDDASSS